MTKTTRRIRALLACGAWLALGGCGDDASVAPPVTAAQRDQLGAKLAEFPYGELPVLYPPRTPPLDEAMLAEIRLRDPAEDGWKSEVLQARAKPVLERFLELELGAAGAKDSELAPLLDPEFAGATELRPTSLATVFDDGATRVARPATPPSTEVHARDRLPALGKDLRDGCAGCSSIAIEVLVVGVTLTSESEFETRAIVRLWGTSGASPHQQELELTVVWRVPEGGAPRIRSLALTGYEEARSKTPLYSEFTSYALADHPFWRAEFLHGIGDVTKRIDRAAGQAFEGMQCIAVGDVDGDGVDDLFVGMQVGTPNRLFVHQPDGRAKDRAPEAKVDLLDVTRGALLVDLDNDGDEDLVQGVASRIVFAYNDGDGTFSHQSAFAADGEEQFYSLSAADADGDGDLDVYACRYALGGVMHGAPSPYYDANNGATDYYLRNDGVGHFVDATAEAGFDSNNHKFGLASIWEDFDGDGDLDLYVSNDFGKKNLFRNDGKGHFEDVADQVGAADVGAGMGASCADFDLDGDVDLFGTNMWSAEGLRIVPFADKFMPQHKELHRWYLKHASGDTLLANRGDGTFDDVTAQAQVGFGRWAWGGLFVDFQGDGYEDLYVPNGQTTNVNDPSDVQDYFWRRVIAQSPPDASSSEPYRTAWGAILHMSVYQDASWSGNERNCAFLNLGDGTFADVSTVSGAGKLDDARAVARVDWDDDGRTDLVVKNRNGPRVRMFHNRAANTASFAAFDLVGKTCNRDAIGARVVLELEGKTLRKRIYAGEGYLAQSTKRLLFGLGGAAKIARATVEWPDGTKDSYTDLAANTRYRIEQGASAPTVVAPRSPEAARALAALPDEDLAADPTQVGRVVLAERLALAPLPLPSFARPSRTVRDLAGSPVLVQLWGNAHPSGEAQLAALSARKPEYDALGLRIVALCVDEGGDLARARGVVDHLGFGADAGAADQHTRSLFEIALLEVLGFTDPVPLPTSFLLDSSGQLVALYLGLLDPVQLASDAAIVKSMSPVQTSTTKLSGGRWLQKRVRDYASLSRFFTTQGDTALAEFYAKLAPAGAHADPSK